MILKYNWNSLYINGVSVNLPAVIEKITIFNDKIILLLNNNEGQIVDKKSFEKSRNVFCVDLEGHILWQIETPEMEKDFYCNASLEDNKLIAVTWNGGTYDLDPETGKISNSRFTK